MLINKCGHNFFLLWLVGFSQLWAQQKTTDFGLIGPIKSVQSVTYLLDFPKNTTASGFLDSQNFDSIYWQFDRQRNLILQENFLDYRGKLGLFDQTVYQINPQNQLEKSVTTLIQNGEEPRKIAQKKVYYYLANRVIRIDEFNSGKNTDQYWVINLSYGTQGLHQKVYWMEDEVFSETKLKYNHKNHLLEELTYGNNGHLTHQKTYENNNFGLPLHIRFGQPKKLNTEKITYGTKYLTEKQVYDDMGALILTEKYNDQGEIAEIHQLNYQTRQTDVYQFKFQKDPKNNWIVCEISKNGRPTFVIKRKINYFK